MEEQSSVITEDVVEEAKESPPSKPKKRTAPKPKNIKEMTAKVKVLRKVLHTSKGRTVQGDIIELPEMEVRRLRDYVERIQ
jgi:hypothetical protein